MSKQKTKKILYSGKFGDIEGSENDESEFKVGLRFLNEISGEQLDRPKGSEARIMAVGEEIWLAYLQHRYAYEERQNAANKPLHLADGDKKPSLHQEQDKEVRLRQFFILAHDHPYDLEIRCEIRDGKKITMLKKGNGATAADPVIRRREIKLVSDIRENMTDILRGLPKTLKRDLGFDFRNSSQVFGALGSNSMRLKTKVRLLADTQFGPLNFVIEPAFDEGSGLTVTQERWPIREFEGEVKGMYKIGSNVDIKADPESAGISYEEMGALCANVLKPERDDYMEFAQLYLLEKARDNPQKYGDIEVSAIYSSKSSPGRRLLLDTLAAEGTTLQRFMVCAKTGLIKTVDWDNQQNSEARPRISLEKTFEPA